MRRHPPTPDSLAATGLWLLAAGGACTFGAAAGLAGAEWWVAALAFFGGGAILPGAGLFLTPVLSKLRRPPAPPRDAS